MGPIWEPKVKPGSFGNPGTLGSACVFDILPVDFGYFERLAFTYSWLILDGKLLGKYSISILLF